MRPSETLIVAWRERLNMVIQAQVTMIKANTLFKHARGNAEMCERATLLTREAHRMREHANRQFCKALKSEWGGRFKVNPVPDNAWTVSVRAPRSDEWHDLKFTKTMRPRVTNPHHRPSTAAEAVIVVNKRMAQHGH